MNAYRTVTLLLIANTLSTWSAPTLIPYDARNAQTRNATIALYKATNPNIQEKFIPHVLEENSTEPGLPKASIFIDDNNKIVGLVIYTLRTIQSHLTAYISELILDKNHKSLTKDLILAFGQEKKFDSITIDVPSANRSFFRELDFKDSTDKKSSLMCKYLSGSSSKK
jgi:hypothetical protein